MYWLRSLPLEKELASGTLPEKSKFLYILVPALFGPPSLILSFFLSPQVTMAKNSTFQMLHLACSVLFAVIAFVGYRDCFRTYAEKNQSGFIESAIILSFPITIRLILMFIPTCVASIWFKTPEQIALLSGTVGTLFNTSFFLLLSRSLRRLGRRTTSFEEHPAAVS